MEWYWIVAAVVVGIPVALFLVVLVYAVFKALTMTSEEKREMQERQAVKAAEKATRRETKDAAREAARAADTAARKAAKHSRSIKKAARAGRQELVKAVRDAEAAQQTRLRLAQKVCDTRLERVAEKVRIAEKRLATAREPLTKPISKFSGRGGSVSLYQTRLVIDGRLVPLDISVRAGVDATGTVTRHSRSTLTRMATGGLLFGVAGGVLPGAIGAVAGGMLKKEVKHDDRELYLVIEGDTFAGVIACHPEQGMAARRFAASVNEHAKSAERAEPRIQRRIVEAVDEEFLAGKELAAERSVMKHAMSLVRADRRTIETAEAALASYDAAMLSDPSEVGKVSV